jgi:hypothetical protein
MSIERPQIPDNLFWGASVLTFGVGDIYTTSKGLQQAEINESNPAAKEILNRFGTGGMVLTKLAVFGASYIAYKNIDGQSKSGIPIGLSILGAGVTLHNASIINQAE